MQSFIDQQELDKNDDHVCFDWFVREEERALACPNPQRQPNPRPLKITDIKTNFFNWAGRRISLGLGSSL